MTAPTDAPEFELRSYLGALWRRKLVIGLVAVVLVGAALVVSLRESALYQGEVRVLLQRQTSESSSTGGSEDSTAANRRVSNEIEVIESAPVQATVRRQLGPHRRVAVSQVGETDVVAVKGQSGQRGRAAAIARAYANAYIDLRRRQAIDDINVATGNLQAKVDDLEAQISGLDRQISDAQQQAYADAAKTNPGNPTSVLRPPSVAGLSAQRDALLAQQTPLKERIDQLQLQAATGPERAQIVSGDVIPVTKIRPHPVRDALIALVLGLALGVAVALLVEHLDDSLKTPDDIKRVLPQLPLLGIVPDFSARRSSSSVTPMTITDSRSPAAEAYTSLRTAMQFLRPHRVPRVFQVTSARAGEGKTSVVANLSVVLARAGQRVVTVDCDLRRPRMHECFRLSNETGFTSVLTGQAALAATVQPVPDVDNLFLLSAGPSPGDPADMLSGRGTAEVFAELQDQFDVVLIDCPPVLPVTDPVAVSAWVDATLLVVQAHTTTRKELLRAVDQLTQAEAPLVGTVLNRTTAYAGYYSYHYERAQGLPDESPNRKGDVAAGSRRRLLARRRIG